MPTWGFALHDDAPTIVSDIPTAPWTPTIISTDIWLDAMAGDTIINEGGFVAQWNDRSGNVRHFSQPTLTSRPVAIENGVFFDNPPVAAYDAATTQYLTLLNYVALRVYPFKTYAVVDAVDTTTTGVIIGAGTNSGTSVSYAFLTTGPNSASAARRNTTQYAATKSTDWSGNQRRLVYGTWDSDTSMSCDVDASGILETNVTSSTTIGVTGATWVGVQRPPLSGWGAASFTGIVREILVVRSDEFKNEIEGYLAWKWNVVANLPISHPYKFAPPEVIL